MHLHPLDPSVKYHHCGKGDLVFIKPRNSCDLYRCMAEIPCKSYTVHSRRGGVCGIAADSAFGMVASTWVECTGGGPAKGVGSMMSVKRTNKDIGLANSLRDVGRRFMDGKPIDIAGLSRLIDAHRDEWPQMCATLTDLIQAASDDTARGDRVSALRHFRAAIELAENPARAKGW